MSNAPLWVRDQRGRYEFNRPATQKEVVGLALRLLKKQFDGSPINNPADTAQYFIARLSNLKREEMYALFLNTKNYVIANECIAQGSLKGAMVHPREVVKRALFHNAGAVIFAHNHPSGIPEPSDSDVTITERLIGALKLFDVTVLDHIVVASDEYVSMSERGLI